MPDASAVAVAVAVPVSDRVAPVPLAAGLIVPETLNVETMALAVKFTPVMLAPLTVTGALAGVNVNPVLLGVTV